MPRRFLATIANIMCAMGIMGLFGIWLLCVELSPRRPLSLFKDIVSCSNREELRQRCSAPARTLDPAVDLPEMVRLGLSPAGTSSSVDLYKCIPPTNFYVVYDKDGRIERVVYYAD